jgi:small subunit ribosomal protein S2
MSEIQHKNGALVESMFKAGSHFAYTRTRRHPSATPFIFGLKNRVEIFDLEKTSEKLLEAKKFIASCAQAGKKVLFVGTKNEARSATQQIASSIEMPYVNLRWIGGSLTNFPEIRRRIDKYEDLMSKREKGELVKYTKKERLLIDREIAKLESSFLGIVAMKEMPAAVVIVDSEKEHIALAEARKQKIPVVAICGSDCDLKKVNYPIPANDSAKASVEFLLRELSSAYMEGVKEAMEAKTAEVKK